MTTYTLYGLSLTKNQKESIRKARDDGTAITIRLSYDHLQGDDKLGLTKSQIERINKRKKMHKGMDLKLSATQIKKMSKIGGILPLLALLPLIFGGIGAAGAAAGGAAAIAKAVNDGKAVAEAQKETERHNREVEKQLGSGLFLRRVGNGLFLGGLKKSYTPF